MRPSQVLKRLNELRKVYQEQTFKFTPEQQKEYEPDLPHVNGKHRLRHPKHEKIHTLLLFYESQWSQLKFVKKRESKVIQHYSQYDDIAGIDDQDRLAGMYKAQEGRYIDIQ